MISDNVAFKKGGSVAIVTVRTLSRVLVLVAAVLLLPAHAVAANSLIPGVLPRHNARKTIHDFRPLPAYLAPVLKHPVKLETSANFKSFWKAVTHWRYDIVRDNQYHYPHSHKPLRYDVIAMNQEFGHDTLINRHKSWWGRNIMQQMAVTNIAPDGEGDYDQYRAIITSLNKLGS